MDPVHAWMDAAEVRRLAESLMHPPAGGIEDLEVEFGDTFEGFTGPPREPLAEPVKADGTPVPTVFQNEAGIKEVVTPPASATHALAAARTRAQEAGLLQPAARETGVPAPVATPVPEPAARAQGESRGPFLQRIERFRDWMHRDFQARGIFLIDREGEVIFDEGGEGKIVRLARSLAHAARTASRRDPLPGAIGNVHMNLGRNATLEVIPVSTRYGMIILAAVVPAAIAPEGISRIMKALSATIEPGRTL